MLQHSNPSSNLNSVPLHIWYKLNREAVRMDRSRRRGHSCRSREQERLMIMLVEETQQAILDMGLPASLLSKEGMVPSSSIDQKNVCLFFSANWCRPCRNFVPQLVELYETVSRRDKTLQVVFVSCDRDEASFMEHFKQMPWLAAPFDDTIVDRLRNKYKINRLPSLIPLSPDGFAVGADAVQLVEEYGRDAFPFSSQRREELKAADDARRCGRPLLDLMGSSDGNYVIRSDLSEVPIRKLVGMTVGLYFGAHWCPPCSPFATMLVDAYDEIRRAQGEVFEVVFVSADRDGEEFKLSLAGVPWLAVAYSHKSRRDLTRIFDIKGIPALVLLGPDGRRMDADGRAMIASYGARAFPFTEARIEELRAALEKEGEGLPELVKDSRHPHLLRLDMAKAYVCDGCAARGRFWVFSCERCNFDLHPSCVEHEQDLFPSIKRAY